MTDSRKATRGKLVLLGIAALAALGAGGFALWTFNPFGWRNAFASEPATPRPVRAIVEERTLAPAGEIVGALAFARGGEVVVGLVMGQSGFQTRVWDVAEGREIARIDGFPMDLVLAMGDATAAPEFGETLTLLDVDGKTARFLDLRTGRAIVAEGALIGGSSNFEFVTPGGRSSSTTTGANWLATRTEAGEILIWDATTGRRTASMRLPVSDPVEVKLSPNGEFLLDAETPTDGSPPRVTMWRVSTGQAVATFPQAPVAVDRGLTESLDHFRFSPDGSLLTFSAQVVRTSDGVSIAQTALARSVSFAPDSRRFLIATNRSTTLRDSANGAVLFVFPVEVDMGHSYGARFSDTGDVIAIQTTEGRREWNAQTLEQIAPPPGKVLGASRDGSRTVYLSQSGLAVLRDNRTGEQIASLVESRNEYQRFVFSPDGRIVRTLGEGDVHHLWNALTGEKLAVLQGGSIRTSPDWSVMATRDSRDNASPTRFWETATGEALLSLEGRVELAFSPDGARLAAAAEGGALRLWRIDYE